jgi:sulfide dehydrogenase [flavocytochrome c] flavoprotein subunit
MDMQRRSIVRGALAGGSLGLAGLAGCASVGGARAGGTVVVVGGGYGGATVSKYIRKFSQGQTRVILVEPNPAFVSCPVSNLVLSGVRTMNDITTPYDALVKTWGVELVRDTVTKVDPGEKTVTLHSGGKTIAYDKLVLSPGIDFMWEGVEGLRAANDGGQILHAWKAGPDTMALRRQLEAMPDGGVYAIVIPEAPYRCPPGPYERASVVQTYFDKHKPKSKVLIIDGNPDVTSKGPLFKKAWAELHPGRIEYRPQHKAVAVDARSRTVKFEIQADVKADVLNVLPPMRAGAIAVQTGLANANARWCHVNFVTFESTAAKDIHVLGDAIQVAPGMPKSGHMANAHAKVCAAAITSMLAGLEPNPNPMLTNVCMSYVDHTHVIHVASVHEYIVAEKTFKTVGGSGGVSDVRSDLEATYADAWAKNIWADALM